MLIRHFFQRCQKCLTRHFSNWQCRPGKKLEVFPNLYRVEYPSFMFLATSLTGGANYLLIFFLNKKTSINYLVAKSLNTRFVKLLVSIFFDNLSTRSSRKRRIQLKHVQQHPSLGLEYPGYFYTLYIIHYVYFVYKRQMYYVVS